MLRTARGFTVLLFLASGASSALMAFVPRVDAIASTAFTGNLCAIPTATELANAGVTTACHKLPVRTATVRSRDNGQVVGPFRVHRYGAVWATKGQKSQLFIKIDQLTGSRKALSAEEQFQVGGGFSFEPHVNVGRHGWTDTFGTHLFSLWGHLYEGMLSLNTPTQPASYANEARATAATTAIGRSIVAALK
jgi:hypothetical protein